MTTPDTCSARILVVDNDARVGADYKILFKPYRVEAAEGSGDSLIESARSIARSLKPHVVIMDLALFGNSDMKGLELLRGKEFSSARCILVSNYLNELGGGPLKISHTASKDADAWVVDKAWPTKELLDYVNEALLERCACCMGFRPGWPSAWDSGKVVETIFGPDSEVPHDAVDDLLGRLFPGGDELQLQNMEGAADPSASLARGHSVVLKATAGTRGPYVVKLALHDRIAREASAYENYVADRLGGSTYSQLQEHCIFWDLGATRYRLFGLRQRPILSFHSFYQNEKNPEAILKPLRHFFAELWRPHYRGTREHLRGNLFEAYDQALRLRRRLEGFPDQDQPITFPGVSVEFTNPVGWVLSNQRDSAIPSASQAVTHGDLHGDNLLAQGELAWAIDFERTGPGPILRDFVELEHDILSRSAQFPTDDLTRFFEFAVAIAAPDGIGQRVELPPHLARDPEVSKALVVVNGLRSLALEVADYEDVREYYWGLLLDSLLGSALAERGSSRWLRSLLLASVLCTRVRRFGMAWPPPEWSAPPRRHPTAPRGGDVASAAAAAISTQDFKDWVGGDDLATVAIVFTDIVDSTRLNVKHGDEFWGKVRTAHFERAAALIRQGRGHLIKTIGDSVMAAFRNASYALDFALELDRETGHELVLTRAGLHVGQVEVSRIDAFGSEVTIAARVCAAGKDGGIWTSAKIKEDIDILRAERHDRLRWIEHPGQELKGFPGLYSVWRVEYR